jgi:energy-coupling factor transporter ATP-binding protein EcfA2
MVAREYERFVTWLASLEPSDDVKRLSNIIHEKLADLIPLGTAGRRRSKVLAPYAIERWEQVTSVLPTHDVVLLADEHPWTKLHRLTVGPFRGFVFEEKFDLQKQITLVYGANGAGKSSLCEALEYALLGEVSEADARRIQGDMYFRNVWAGIYESPALIAVCPEGNEVNVIPNEEAYRFCFVEKNRIDAFSRLASRTPAEKTKLIATLFGIDQFSDFVRGFNDELDPQLDLIGAKAQLLKEARMALGTAVKLIAGESEREEAFRTEEIALAGEFNQTITYDELKAHIGTPENPGRLDAIRKKLEEAPLITIGVTHAALEEGLKDILRADGDLQNKQSALLDRSSQVSFQQLFNAVEALQSEIPDRCPACDTPLQGEHAVLRNPYEKAKDGLAGLADLAQLQVEIETLEGELNSASTQLHGLLNKMRAHFEKAGILIPELGTIKQRWWDALPLCETKQWDRILETASTIEKLDELAANNTSARMLLGKERDSLVEIDRRIIALESRKSAWDEEIKSARELIERFEVENQALIREVEAERPAVVLQNRIKQAYDAFLPLLKNYVSALPGTLLADLGETTKNLFNAFNRADRPDDQLSHLWLPTTAEGKIELAFCGTPTIRHDALQILSEGHIRCLGLALLVAKNIKQGCSVLIFDDAVNAIDDDHRDGIWRTLFEDAWLGDKQILLTCHGQEFIKLIQQGLGAERVRNHCTYYELLPHDGNHHPAIDTSPRTKNYVLSAQGYIARQDSRNALSESRRALEGLSRRLWKWESNFAPATIKLTFRVPGGKPELRNLCEQLKSLLTNPHFVHERKDPLINALNVLLGVDGSSPEWSYLNTGTHEDERPEFDRGTVTRIVEAITGIDAALTASRSLLD